MPPIQTADCAAIGLSALGTHQSGIYEESVAEAITYNAASKRSFVINAAAGAVDVMDLFDPIPPATSTEIGEGVN